jgi:hypothetical protein
MKYILLSVILCAAVFTGCVTLPDPIDDVYLSEKTNDQSAKLDRIGTDIIAKKKDKDKVEKELEIANQKIEASRTDVTQAEAAGEALLEKEKLYEMTKDSKLEEIQKEKEKNKIKTAQSKAYLAYCIAKADETGAMFEVKKAELAAKVAELDYEKSLIAKAYQTKRSDEYKDKMIDDLEYKKFLEDQRAKLEDNRKKYEKASKSLSDADANLKKSGYEGEK